MPAYSFLPSLSLAFHGCGRAVADRVIGGRGHLKPSDNPYDWLGTGIYFWENDPTRAREWAIDLQRRGKVDRPAVVGAVIDLGRCLNLLDREYLKLVRQAYRHLLKVSNDAGTPLPRNRELPGRPGLLLRELDCATINICRETQVGRDVPPFDTVRAAFVEGEPLYPSAGFNDRNHIQLCVVNPRCIKGYFRPLAGGAA
jgi:hypothetical protein